MYDFKIFLPTEENNILVFHAWIADQESYYIKDVPHFGIHKTYKNLFIQILNKTLKINTIETENENIKYIEKNITDCGNKINQQYLECCSKFLENSFGIIVKVDEFEMNKMLELRYDAPDMNLEYGISPNISKKIYSFTNELVDIVQANNTNYGGILQQQAKTGSTIIPYLSEKIDIEANNIIIKVIDDINSGIINRNFANSDKPLACVYKKMIKKMSELRQIKDLEIFEIFIYNENGKREKKSVDLNQIALIENQLFGDQVQKKGTIRRPAFVLKSKPNIHSAKIDIEDKVYAIHIDTQNESFDRMKKILEENKGKKVIINGYKDAEYTIIATHIYLI